MMIQTVARNNYLPRLIDLREKNVIKIVTGIRRCGKSILLWQFQEYLKQSGVSDEQIISLNFEELENAHLTDYKKLNEYLMNKITKGKYTYIFLDEIQMVEDFQRVVDSIYAKNGRNGILVDIYLTGSNSYLLSGQISTLLSGRFVEISMLPLSFKEYLALKKSLDFPRPSSELMSGSEPISPSELISLGEDISSSELISSSESAKHSSQTPSKAKGKKESQTQSKMDRAYAQSVLSDYLRFGGFPQTLELDNESSINSYLDGVLNTVIVKDILYRETSIDTEALKMILKFIAHSVGSPISSSKIANTLTTNGRKISYNTVERYLGCLMSSFVIYEVGRYDIKGKEHLKKNAKYYIVDVGLRRILLSNKESDIGHLLENTVYLELLRRNPKSITISRDQKIASGKLDTKEIDFVVQNQNETIYYQVAASLTDKSTLERELAPLKAIKDNYPKFIITLDDYTSGTTHDGIQITNILDFLQEN